MDQEESRMIRKEREDEYREDARREEAEENACPCCGSQLRHSRCLEDGRYVESGVSCRCGYSCGESYGHRYLELPEGFIENDQGDIVNTNEEGEESI